MKTVNEILKQLSAYLLRSSMKKQQPRLLNTVAVSTASTPNSFSLISRALRKHLVASSYSSALQSTSPRPQQGSARSGFRQLSFQAKTLQLQKQLKAQSSFPADRYTPPRVNSKNNYRLGLSSFTSSFHISCALLQFYIASAYRLSLWALMPASMKGIMGSGISFGQRIYAIMEGNGSRGMLPLSNDERGFKEQSSYVASFWKQSSELQIFLVCTFSSLYWKIRGGFSPFFSCGFFLGGIFICLFLSCFQGGGCWPIVIFQISLNLGANGGKFSCLTSISSGMGGSSLSKALTMTLMLISAGLDQSKLFCFSLIS